MAKEGWLRPSTKCREASLAGADGVVGSSHLLSVVEQTTPAAPSKEGNNFFSGASTPPWPRRGVLLLLGDFKVPFAVVVIPAAAHDVFVELAVDHVVDSLVPALRLGFHVNGIGLRVE